MTAAVRTTRGGTRPGASVPDIGPWMPATTVHLAFLAVSAGLCVLMLEAPFWLAVGLLLAGAGTFLPSVVHKGWVILVLGLSQLWREPSFSDPVFYLLLAGVHLLHVIGSVAAHISWRGRMQTPAFVQPLKRFVLVQLVVQSLAVAALFAFRGAPGTVPGLSIFSAAVLGVIAVVFARRLRRG